LLQAGARVAITDVPHCTLDEVLQEPTPLDEVMAVAGDAKDV